MTTLDSPGTADGQPVLAVPLWVDTSDAAVGALNYGPDWDSGPALPEPMGYVG